MTDPKNYSITFYLASYPLLWENFLDDLKLIFSKISIGALPVP